MLLNLDFYLGRYTVFAQTIFTNINKRYNKILIKLHDKIKMSISVKIHLKKQSILYSSEECEAQAVSP